MTDAHELDVGTVVCVHDKEMKEAWCLVASEGKVATRTLIRYYGKRWGIETSFRDIKDMRFGMGLSSMDLPRICGHLMVFAPVGLGCDNRSG